MSFGPTTRYYKMSIILVDINNKIDFEKVIYTDSRWSSSAHQVVEEFIRYKSFLDKDLIDALANINIDVNDFMEAVKIGLISQATQLYDADDLSLIIVVKKKMSDDEERVQYALGTFPICYFNIQVGLK